MAKDWDKVDVGPLVETAYAVWVENLPEENDLFTTDELLALAGQVKPSKRMTNAEHKSFQFFMLRYTEALKKKLLEVEGRLLTNVWGEGYRLAAPRENVRIAERRLMKRVKGAISRTKEVYKHTRPEALTSSERADKAMAVHHLNLFDMHFNSYDEARKENPFNGYKDHGLGWTNVVSDEVSAGDAVSEETDDFDDF